MEKMSVGVINFFSGKKDFRSLSNFWENEVMVDGRLYESGEHGFKGVKYRRLSEFCEEDRKKQLFEYGQTFLKPSPYKNGALVKRAGGKKGFPLNPDELTRWFEISMEVQRSICLWKKENYEEVREDLRKSGSNLLVHPALRCSPEKLKDRIWEGKGAVVDGQIVVLGQNRLGNLWMEIR